jgi:7-carboxy-7-deazaguanine synthase
MNIIEIFASIQGESTLQGLPCVFIRLAGCNLHCRYCDTAYAREGGTEREISGIVREADRFGLGFACITGGEPLLQPGTPDLARELLVRGYRVSVETNGSLDASVLPIETVRIIDIKTPGSGEEGSIHPANLAGTRPTDEFKFVLTGRTDFEYARHFSRKHSLAEKGAVLLSPVRSALDPALLVKWSLGEMREARLNLQLHTFIWPGDTRGR